MKGGGALHQLGSLREARELGPDKLALHPQGSLAIWKQALAFIPPLQPFNQWQALLTAQRA